ncbi:MAG TPA: PRC-barrel domain-containing protein [Burkholderiaceae bacterium]|nr:PRC-barrel domain-containing protein [Burkholderiaceae bacterium]
MLRTASELTGFTVAGSDGDVGTLEDLYFDDTKWAVRHFVVDAGGWLTGRKVLLSPRAAVAIDWDSRRLTLDLTKRQIEDSPDIDTDKPVSRQHEVLLYDYYGYPYYWSGPYLWGDAGFPAIMPGTWHAPDEAVPTSAERANRTRGAAGLGTAADTGSVATRGPTPAYAPGTQRDRLTGDVAIDERQRGDPHLRSARNVTGYDIRATDDFIGHVEDLLIDDEDWSIPLIVVDTRNWWPGKKVLLAPSRIDAISWEDGRVTVKLTREQVENSAEFDASNPPARESRSELYRPLDWPPRNRP